MATVTFDPENIIGYDFDQADIPISLPLDLDALAGSPASITMVFEMGLPDDIMNDLSDSNIINPISSLSFQVTVDRNTGVILCTPFLRLDGVRYNKPDLSYNTAAPTTETVVWNADPSRNENWFLANILRINFGLEITLFSSTGSELTSVQGIITYTENLNKAVPLNGFNSPEMNFSSGSSIIIRKDPS